LSFVNEEGARRELGYLAMQDGTRIAYIVWLPLDSGSYPTVLNYSCYGESGTPLDQALRFLRAGYAYVGANVRGTGASQGVFSYFQPIEAADGAELVEWIGTQPWCDGNVGMIGASYGAHTQIAVAAHHPTHLRAIVPLSVEGCEYRDEAMPGGLFNVGMLAEWTYRVQPELARIGADARASRGDHQCIATRARQRPNRCYEEVREHPLLDGWWRSRSLEMMIDRVRVPTLFIQAWQDEWIRPDGALRLFELSGSVHKRICLQNGPHRLTPYLLNQREQVRWLDRWVKGDLNGIESEPPVTVHWEVSGLADGANPEPQWTTSYSTWPPSQRRWLSLYLTATGELALEPGETDENGGPRCYVYPLATELVADETQFRLVPSPVGVLSYRSAPLAEDTVLLGSAQLTLYMSSDQSDAAFMFILKDVDPNGGTLFLQKSFLRASLRAVDEATSTPDEARQSFTKYDPLVPGEVFDITVSLSALGHRFRAGHRVELSILSPNTVPSPVWSFAPALPASINKVYHGSSFPSRLRLPLDSGQHPLLTGTRPSSLRNQPSR
jgi:predicted acyl esterase